MKYTIIYRRGKAIDDVAKVQITASSKEDAENIFKSAYPKLKIISVTEDVAKD